MSWDIDDELDQGEMDEERVQRRLAKSRMNRGPAGRLPVRLGAVITVVVAATFIGWLIFGQSSNKKSSISNPGTSSGGTSPVALSYGGLRTFVAGLKQPVYWVGTKPRSSYEFRQLSNGNVYLRYLPSGTPAGDPSTFLTVGTYAMGNAFGVVQGLAKGKSVVPIKVGGNAAAFSPSRNATDAYVAFSGSDYQIEVYSPTPGVARRLVARGIVASVPGSPAGTGGVTATSPAKLRRLASSLGQPIYWASREAGRTLEVRQTNQGYIYVRYLPKGVAVGDPGAYRSIATYPLANAFAVTKALGQQAGNTLVNLPGGGIGVYAKQGGTDAYAAFPGSDFQVEVFDPTPGAARNLVSSGKIVPLR